MALTFTGANGTTSATIPSHSAGDLIVLFAYRDGNNAVPTIPSGQNWTTVFNTGGANTNSHVIVAKTATSSSETTGTFTNASRVEVVVIKTDISGGTLGYKNGASGSGASTTLSFTGFTLDNPNSTSRVLAFAGHRSTNTTTDQPPTGFTNINTGVDATAEAASHRSTSVVSTFSTTTQSVGGTSSGWRTHTMEVWEIPPDVTAPTLTSPTGTEVGGTGYSGTVTTDEGNGTLYYWVTQNATETAANVVANGATQAVTTSGVQNVSGTGLSTLTSYYIHYVHVDAASNQSSRVSSSQFTTLSTVTIVISENTGADFSSVPDSRLLEYASTTNYGTDSALWIGAFEASVIRFDGLSDGSLDGGTVSGAVLRFKTPYDKSATTDLVIAKLASAFDESTVTWANVGSSTNIGTFAYGGSGDILITGAWLDAYLQDVIDGTEANNGLRISASDGYALTTSSEGTNGDRPSLTFDIAFDTGITASSNITLAALTATANGSLSISASASATLAPLTSTASSSLSISGNSNVTLAPLTASATIGADITASTNVTLAPLTSTATGSLSIAGSVSKTLAALTASATASLSIAGNVNKTLAPLTSTATGSLSIAGNVNKTLAPLTSTATGSLSIAGNVNKTLAPLTSTATGSLSISANSNATLAPLTATAVANLADGTISASVNRTLAALTANAQAQMVIAGGVTVTLAPVTASATASLSIAATSNNTLAPLISSAVAEMLFIANVSYTLQPLTSSGAIGELITWNGIPEKNNIWPSQRNTFLLRPARTQLALKQVRTGLHLNKLH